MSADKFSIAQAAIDAEELLLLVDVICPKCLTKLATGIMRLPFTMELNIDAHVPDRIQFVGTEYQTIEGQKTVNKVQGLGGFSGPFACDCISKPVMKIMQSVATASQTETESPARANEE